MGTRLYLSGTEGFIGQGMKVALDHGVDFNLSFIDRSYPSADHNLFDTTFMRGLFTYGEKLGETGTFWAKVPPAQDE